MTNEEVETLNQLLKTFEGRKNNISGIFIDNLHHPFVLLKGKYVLPSISIHSIEFSAIKKFLEEAGKFIPEMISNCHIMPYPKPKKEYSKLSLLKLIELNNFLYLYIIKLDIAYLGGAYKEDIIQEAKQDYTASVLTDRFYFSIRVIPIKKTIKHKESIVDFESTHYNLSSLNIETSDEGIGGIPSKVESELFDEIDYSQVLHKLQKDLYINQNNWQLGRVYNPIAIEYSTLSILFLEPSFKIVKENFEQFSSLLEAIHLNNLNKIEKDKENFIKWMKIHRMSRTKSTSGNILWKVSFLKGMEK